MTNYKTYLIYQDGKVFSTKRNKFLIPRLTNRGYYQFNLGGEQIYIHQLLGELFISNPNNYKVINHINGIKTDNRVENLEWCTQRHNVNHYHKSDNVTLLPSGKFRSRCYHDKKTKHLGCFNSREEARNAYINYVSQL